MPEPYPAIRYSRDEPWQCTRRMRRGWVCRRGLHLDGPCALVPAWWNLRARAWMRRNGLR